MSAWSELLSYCYLQENLFVDEIDRIQTSPEQLRLFPENALQSGGGWLFMAGELGSGDWNLARQIGDAKTAADQTDLLPPLETHLLVSGDAAPLFVEKFKQLGSLVYFSNADELLSNKDLSGAADRTAVCREAVDAMIAQLQSADFTVKFRDSTGNSPAQPQDDVTIYLLANDRVQGYIKTIRNTRSCLEVYIEVIPSLRRRGLGKALLRLALSKAGISGKAIVYAVDEENVASMATARSAGLHEILRLSRFLKPAPPRYE